VWCRKLLEDAWESIEEKLPLNPHQLVCKRHHKIYQEPLSSTQLLLLCQPAFCKILYQTCVSRGFINYNVNTVHVKLHAFFPLTWVIKKCAIKLGWPTIIDVFCEGYWLNRIIVVLMCRCVWLPPPLVYHHSLGMVTTLRVNKIS